MKKAERIWQNTFYMIKGFVKDENITVKEFTMGFDCKENESVTARTVNEIEKINEREFNRYNWEIEKGFRKEDAVKTQTFINMRNSINQWRKNEAEWNKMIASIN